MNASVVRFTRSPSAACAAMMWQTASGTPHSIASATPVNGWRNASPRSLCRLLPSGPISYSSNLPTSARIAAAITTSASIGSARPLKAGRAVACNVHHATLVLHERDRTIRNQQGKRNLIQVLGLQRTSLQRLDPGLRYLLPKLGILDPLNFRPQSFDGLPHGQGLLTELTRLSESMRMRRADAPRLCDLKCDWQSMKIRNEDYFSIGSSSD